MERDTAFGGSRLGQWPSRSVLGVEVREIQQVSQTLTVRDRTGEAW